MKAFRKRRILSLLTATSLGTVWLAGCITDLQFRDFVQSTTIRVFWQTIGTAVQAAIINAFGTSNTTTSTGG